MKRVSQRWYSMKEAPGRDMLGLAARLGYMLAPPCCNERVGGKHRFVAGSCHPRDP